MSKKSVIFTTLSLLLATPFLNSIANAGDIEWSGLYRIEGYSIQNSELRGGEIAGQPDSGKKKKLGYGLSHLVLRPKITAGDGITIYGQFDIFNSTDYPNSQMGATYGDGVRSAGTTSTSANNSNALSHTQKAETIEVSQLYMTLNQEFSQLIVGRAPMQFGLGMTYSAGRGLFDHWYDTSDMVGYKVIMGNIYFLPMIGRPSGGTINNSDNIDDYMIHVQYENPESDIEMGIFYKLRHSGDQASDAPIGAGTGTGAVIGGPSAKNGGGINTKIVNVYALRDNERFRVGMEAAFMSGETGVQTGSNSDKVEWGGFGIAGEFEYRPEASHWKWGLKAGSASGDDPTTDAKYEGFQFNRNYDVAMLLFNHPLGQNDFLRSRLATGAVNNGTDTNINKADVETISNVMYLAPIAKYSFNDRWSLDNTIVTGWLSANPIAGSSGSKDIGYEYDATLNFTPRKGVAWINQMGFLFPGAAWKSGGTYDAQMAYGFATKAAISF